jgi:hypothetical protein
MRALVGCLRCSFVTRRRSALGRAETCPKCEGQMEELTLSQARALLHHKAHERITGPSTAEPASRV